MNELARMDAGALAAGGDAGKILEALATMAAMLQATNESMEQLRRQVRLLEKVTPAQAAALNRAIREKAREECALYGATGAERKAAAAIRRDVKLQFGAGTVKELPRCDYPAAAEYVRGWDDYGTMRRMTAGGER